VPVNPEIGVKAQTIGTVIAEGNVNFITGVYDEFMMRSLEGVI